ncbi:MAG: hypothetical protein M1830_000859, partial [Pleopsidium flavum]
MLKSNTKFISLLSNRTQYFSKRTFQTTSAIMQNDQGQGTSHATGGSKVPQTAQDKLPQGVEENVPNTIHDTGSSGAKSHAVGDSKVPKAVQEAVPEKLERALPNAIHDTGIDVVTQRGQPWIGLVVDAARIPSPV